MHELIKLNNYLNLGASNGPVGWSRLRMLLRIQRQDRIVGDKNR